MKLKILVLTILVASFSFGIVSPVMAGWVNDVIGTELIPTDCTDPQTGNVNQCGLTHVFQTIINFSKLLLALTGSAALLMFIYGGVMWIISFGNPERVQKGKAAMQAAAIGLIIILSAFLIVNFTIFALTGGNVGDVKIFNQDWFKEPGTTPNSTGSGREHPIGAI